MVTLTLQKDWSEVKEQDSKYVYTEEGPFFEAINLSKVLLNNVISIEENQLTFDEKDLVGDAGKGRIDLTRKECFLLKGVGKLKAHAYVEELDLVNEEIRIRLTDKFNGVGSVKSTSIPTFGIEPNKLLRILDELNVIYLSTKSSFVVTSHQQFYNFIKVEPPSEEELDDFFKQIKK